MSLTMVLATLTALGVLITIHEFGHFWVARRCGVRVLTFSIGFGPTLGRVTDKHGTEYRIAALPLGGYVRMLDSREGEVDPAQYSESFDHKTLGQRAAIVAAGPAINLLFAALIYAVLAFVGRDYVAPILGPVTAGSAADQAGLREGYEIISVKDRAVRGWQDVGISILSDAGESQPVPIVQRRPGDSIEQRVLLDVSGLSGELNDPLQQLGISPWTPDVAAVISDVVPDTPAEQAGLMAGDRITAIDGRAVNSWQDLVSMISQAPNQSLLMTIDRLGRSMEMNITPAPSEQDPNVGRIGVYPVAPDVPADFVRTDRSGPLEAVWRGVARTYDMSVFTVEAIVKMISGALSPANLSGPISIAKVATASAESGLLPYLGFLALLSVSLGVLNLMPIPVLDGGHLMWYAIEAIRGKAVSERIQPLACESA